MTSTKDKVTQRVTDVVLREGAQRRPHRRHSCCGQRQAALFIQAYKSKQAIFEACTDFFSERVADVGNAIGLPGSAGTEGSYADVGVEEIVDFTTQLLVFYQHDDVVAKFRRMLTIERHREPKLNREIERLFIDGAIEHEEKVFTELMDAGLIERQSPHIFALRFYTSIFYRMQNTI